MTARRSVSGGSAPRSRRAASWPFTSLVVAPSMSRRKASRRVPVRRATMPKSSSAVRPSAHHEQVPAVEVAVEDAVDHRPFHEGHHAGADHRLRVDARRLHGLDVVELEAVEPLHHEHPAGDEVRVGPGDDVAALAEVGQHPGHVEHVLGLEPEVQLLGDRLGEELDERGRVGQRGDRDAPDEVRGEPRHRPQVLADEGVDGGPLHLHDDGLAAAESGGVHLGDRGGGERLAVEPLEGGLEGGAELALHDRRAPLRTSRPAPGRGRA